MVYSVEQKSFMIESYFRNGRKINDEWSYSIQDCLEEFRVEFPTVAVDYKQFRECLNYSVKLFRETGSIKRKDGSGRSKKRTPEIVDEVEVIMENQPKTSLRHLSQQVNLSVETCRTILKKDLH
ncbi:HTH 29 domain containing protein, partial [Asbolus verrucosus]